MYVIFRIHEMYIQNCAMFERLWYLLCKSCQNREKILSKRISVSDVNRTAAAANPIPPAAMIRCMCKKDRIPVNKADGRSENLGGQIVIKGLLKVKVKILLLPKYMGGIAPLPTSVSYRPAYFHG